MGVLPNIPTKLLSPSLPISSAANTQFCSSNVGVIRETEQAPNHKTQPNHDCLPWKEKNEKIC